jgi:hypothetical protein
MLMTAAVLVSLNQADKLWMGKTGESVGEGEGVEVEEGNGKKNR